MWSSREPHAMVVTASRLSALLYVLRILFFVAFFVGTGLAYHFRDRFRLRRAFVVTFFACLLVVNVTSVAFPPVVDLHKFSGPGPEEKTVHEITIVDDRGNELPVDTREIEPVPPSRQDLLASKMVHHCDESERRRVAAYVLEEAREYRERVESESVVSAEDVEFPEDEYGYRWTDERLADYDELVSLRVYAIRLTMTADGSAVESRTDELVYEYSPQSENETVGDAATVRGGPVCS